MNKKIISFDGTSISYKISRNSPDYVVLLHGISKSSKFWKKEEDLLNKVGFSTIVPDLRGHGKSGKPMNKDDYNLEKFAMDIHHILKAENTGKVNIIGHSFGGGIAIIYYKLFKDNVKSLVLVNPDYKVPITLQLIFRTRAFFKLLNYLRSFDKSNNLMPEHVIRYCLDNMMQYSRESKKQNFRLFSNIKVPVLFIKSSWDEVIPARHLKKMYGMMKGASLQVVDAHHDVFNEIPKEAGKHIFNFFSSNHLIGNLSTAGIFILLALGIGLLSTPSFLSYLAHGGITGAVVGTEIAASGVKLSTFAANSSLSAALLLAFVYCCKRYE